MKVGDKISYDKLWHIFKNFKDAKWKIVDYKGNFLFLLPKIINYVKIAEILDINETGPCGKNEAGYKVACFECYERNDSNDNIVAGGFALDKWPDFVYDISITNIEPLELHIKLDNKVEGFTSDVKIRMLNDKEDYNLRGNVDIKFKRWLHVVFSYFSGNVLISNSWDSYVIYQYDYERNTLKSSFNEIDLEQVDNWKIAKELDGTYTLSLYSEDNLWESFRIAELKSTKINEELLNCLENEK